jgi:hypothetical protein
MAMLDERLELADATRHDGASGGHVLEHLQGRVVEPIEARVGRHRHVHGA